MKISLVVHVLVECATLMASGRQGQLCLRVACGQLRGQSTSLDEYRNPAPAVHPSQLQFSTEDLQLAGVEGQTDGKLCSSGEGGTDGMDLPVCTLIIHEMLMARQHNTTERQSNTTQLAQGSYFSKKNLPTLGGT